MSEGPSKLENLLVSLTKLEFSLVWGIDAIRDSKEYGEHFEAVDNYGTPGFDDRDDLYCERLLRVIRWLNFEKDYFFQWIHVHEGGSITRASEMIEPGNAQYEILLAMGGVDYPKNLRDGAELASIAELNDLANLLADAAENAREAKAYRLKHTDPEAYKRYQEQNDEILASVGVQRKEVLN